MLCPHSGLPPYPVQRFVAVLPAALLLPTWQAVVSCPDLSYWMARGQHLVSTSPSQDGSSCCTATRGGYPTVSNSTRLLKTAAVRALLAALPSPQIRAREVCGVRERMMHKCPCQVELPLCCRPSPVPTAALAGVAPPQTAPSHRFRRFRRFRRSRRFPLQKDGRRTGTHLRKAAEEAETGSPQSHSLAAAFTRKARSYTPCCVRSIAPDLQ